jgi:uncharacterized membrane protein (UPF0127 family)
MGLLKKILAFYLFTFFIFSCKQGNKSIDTIEQHIEFTKEGVLEIKKDSTTTIKLDIEVADNEYKRQTGLMYRTLLDEKQSMLFIFEDEKQRYFYMKNTYIPLDIIFINEDKKIVSAVENAKATDETSLPSSEPIQYVLEVNAGLFKKWGLEVGDQIKFNRSIK